MGMSALNSYLRGEKAASRLSALLTIKTRTILLNPFRILALIR
jgi:hypothetical protein